MVRVTGLEPVRHKHTPLKRACLPVPAHSHLSLRQHKLLYYFFLCLSTLFFKKIIFFNFTGMRKKFEDSYKFLSHGLKRKEHISL